MVVLFIRVRWIRSGSPWGSLGSSEFTRCTLGVAVLDSSVVVWFTRVRAGGRWVHLGSSHSLEFALGLIPGRWVPSGSRWGSLGSSGAVGFTRVRPACCWVHPGSLGSLGFALSVVGFIRGRWVRTRTHPGSLGSLEHEGHWVHPRSLGLHWLAQWVHPGRWVHLGSPCGGFIRGHCVHSGSPTGSLVYPGSLGSLGSSGDVGFTRVRHRGRWVLPDALSSLGFSLRVVGFIQSRWVHSGWPWESLGLSGVADFTRVLRS